MKMKITNFQSIENAELEIPEKSFTCIVGPTNIGKSAIRRALECVLYNKSEVSYIRKGCKQCEVEITFDDGMHVKWARDNKTAMYEINGESYSKLAGSVPEPLLQKGFKELSISKDKLNVQIAHQFENIFLLNQTGSRVTEVLSNLGNLNRIISANKGCLSDKKAKRSKLKVRKEDFLLEKEKLNAFTGIDDQRPKIDSLKAILDEIKDLRNKKEQVLKLDSKLNKSKNIVANLRKMKDLELPQDDISLDKFKDLQKISKSYSVLSNKVESYSDLSKVNEIDFNINDDYAKFAKIKKLYETIIVVKQKISNYKNLPEKVEDFELKVDDIVTLSKLEKKLTATKQNVLNYRNKLKEEEGNLEKLTEEQDAIKKELKVCPLCDSELH